MYGFESGKPNFSNRHANHRQQMEPLLSLYQDGEATPEERHTVEYYLARCAECRNILSSFQQVEMDLLGLLSSVSAPKLDMNSFKSETLFTEQSASGKTKVRTLHSKPLPSNVTPIMPYIGSNPGHSRKAGVASRYGATLAACALLAGVGLLLFFSIQNLATQPYPKVLTDVAYASPSIAFKVTNSVTSSTNDRANSTSTSTSEVTNDIKKTSTVSPTVAAQSSTSNSSNVQSTTVNNRTVSLTTSTQNNAENTASFGTAVLAPKSTSQPVSTSPLAVANTVAPNSTTSIVTVVTTVAPVALTNTSVPSTTSSTALLTTQPAQSPINTDSTPDNTPTTNRLSNTDTPVTTKNSNGNEPNTSVSSSTNTPAATSTSNTTEAKGITPAASPKIATANTITNTTQPASSVTTEANTVTNTTTISDTATIVTPISTTSQTTQSGIVSTPVHAVGLLAYVSTKDGAIHLVASDGSNDRVFVKGSGNVAWQQLIWSPDARWLAAVGRDSTSDIFSIYLLDTQSTSPDSQPIVEGIQPVWSQDGRNIAYLGNSYVSGGVRIGKPRIINLKSRIVTHLSDITTGLAPQWFPDSQRLLVGQEDIYKIELISKTSGYNVILSQHLGIGNANTCLGNSLSPDGTKVATLERDKKGAFLPVIYNLTRSELTVKPLNPLSGIAGDAKVGRSCGDTRLNWTPSSQAFFFYAQNGNDYYNIVVNASTGQANYLANVFAPTFSPDGVYLADLNPQNREVYAINANAGGRPTNPYPVAGSVAFAPVWQPSH